MNVDSNAVINIIRKHYIDVDKYPVCLIGIRGADPTKPNEFNKYDDLLIWVSPNVLCKYNANTDPKIEGQAVLQVGVWMYTPGPHPWDSEKSYPAFRQASNVSVMRGDKKDFGYFGINIHKGGVHTTGSEGCQTLPPHLWQAFKTVGYTELERHSLKDFPYILTDSVSM